MMTDFQAGPRSPNSAVPTATILVVDDSETGRSVTTRFLQKAGYEVRQASTARRALRAAAERPDLIVLDVNLPDMNGIDLCKQLKANTATAHIPVLFLSAEFLDDRSKVEGLESGGDGYLTRPVESALLISTVKTLLRLRRAEASAAASEARLRAIIEAAPEAVTLIGAEGQLLEINAAGLEIMEAANAADVVGTIVDSRIATEYREAFRTLIERACGGARGVLEFEFVGLGGTHRILESHVVPFPQGADDGPLALAVMRDVTDRKRTEEQIRQLNSELEQLVVKRTEALEDTNAEIDGFAYSVAHDLRAPLRAMQGFADALIEEYGDQIGATGRDYAHRVVTASRRMDRLVLDLLEYSRLSRSQLVLEPVALESAVTDALAHVTQALALQDDMGARHLGVTVERPFPKVIAHRATLVQIVSHLLTNAAKFVRPGIESRIRVWAEVVDTQSTAARARVRLSVQDNGIGIAPHHQERIFHVFERLHGVDVYPGTGIGLAIVSKGITRIGGRVGVQSMPGEGSTFWVDLAFAED